jgi:hypothetical protein
MNAYWGLSLVGIISRGEGEAKGLKRMEVHYVLTYEDRIGINPVLGGGRR